MSLLVLSASDVRNVATSFSTTFLQELMGRVFTAFSRRSNSEDAAAPSIQAPPRAAIEMKSHTTLFMPVRVTSPQDALEGTTATTLILNEETGAVEVVLNARELTALRNAAGSLLSATLVGIRKPQNIVFFGAGKQVEAHLDVFLRHYPSVSCCTIINRNINERALDLYKAAIATFPRATFHLVPRKEEATVKKSVEAADIIICATSSTFPLFSSSWVSSGTHVILVGSYRPHMQEVEEALIHRAESSSLPSLGPRIRRAIIVDSREGCAREAGDLIKAKVDQKSWIEIGELLLQGGNSLLADEKPQIPEESNEEDASDSVTIYKSVGIGLQDTAMAKEVVAYAKNAHLGTWIKNYDRAV